MEQGKDEQTCSKGQNPGQTREAPCQNQYAAPIIYCAYALNIYCQNLRSTDLALLMLHVLIAKSVIFVRLSLS